ncbi:MAG: hypothetical protein K0S19_1649 [Geminicoccaceae bacterium]|nr:hypothetical protein [Geminicoccaceae bacterium]
MAQDDPAGDGAEAEQASGAALPEVMAEFEELIRRIIAAPPKTYDEVKLGKRRRRGGVAKGGVRRR